MGCIGIQTAYREGLVAPARAVARRGRQRPTPIRGVDRVGSTPEVKPMSRRPMPNALDLDLRGGLTDAVTPHAGVTLRIDLGRRSGVIPAAEVIGEGPGAEPVRRSLRAAE